MRRIARRLERHIATIETPGKIAVCDQIVEHAIEKRGILGVDAQAVVHCWSEAASLAQRRGYVTIRGIRRPQNLSAGKFTGPTSSSCRAIAKRSVIPAMKSPTVRNFSSRGPARRQASGSSA